MTHKSNYVGAWFDWNEDKVVVAERDNSTGERFLQKWPAPYHFYIPSEEGEFETLCENSVKRLDFDSRETFDAAKQRFPLRFESDISPLDRVLMTEYYGRDTPPVNFALFDIEVDTRSELGWARPSNPYAPINAVTTYQSWSKQYVTYAIPPEGWNGTLPTEKEMREDFGFDVAPNIVLCKDEMELLLGFLDSIANADIISGWNSDFFDIPYIVKRVALVLGKRALGHIGYPGAPLPKERMVTRFGTEELTYRISGRNHLDYLQLFQKFTFEGRTSYALANIANEELDIPKLEYDGTLEELYNKDFEHFLRYNIRDVEILKRLDDKFKFIALVNQMAHENTVLFESVLGTVKYVETGITNHAHYVLNKIVNDKRIEDHDKVEGAIVLSPKIGLHPYIGAVDLSSLYPNTIRTLNISPEKIIGQFTNKIDEEDWKIIRSSSDKNCCLITEDGAQHIATGREWKKILAEKKWAISAYGTVFDQSSGYGVIADILGYWYNERKRLQGEKKKWGKEAKRLAKLLKTDPSQQEAYDHAKRQEEQFDLLQLTKKISMNSLYGALLNKAFRFGNERLGASVTASGRQITTHMIETISESITGERARLEKRYASKDVAGLPKLYATGKRHVHESEETWNEFLHRLPSQNPGGWSALYATDNEAIIYGDTDSCYFKTFATNKEEAIAIADLVAENVNASFGPFVREAFMCQEGYDTFLSAGREIVGVRGLFQAKKKYMIKVIDEEGVAVDKMKSMGSEIKKADTPKIIQEFIKTTVNMILNGEEYGDIAKFVNDQRKSILKNANNVFLLGVAKQVNNLDKFYAEYLQYEKSGIKKAKLPGHVRASVNYIEMLKFIGDKGSKEISSGDKVLIFYVKPNTFKIEAIAIPSESTKFPVWFDDHFKVDIGKTEEKMFDNKLGGVFKALGMVVPSPQSELVRKLVVF